MTGHLDRALADLRARRAPDNPFPLSSTLDGPATREEVAQAWPGTELPEQLEHLWSRVREARLFADEEHGQWGLVLLAPRTSAERTAVERAASPARYRADDVVVGEFLGDSELLVVAADGRVLVALPLDDRDDWYAAADDLAGFLTAYAAAAGEKYWERPAT